MMRALFAVLLAGVLLALSLSVRAQSIPVPPLASPVVDTTGTLTSAQIVRLERQALALQKRNGSQLQILMLASTGSESIEDYAQRAFETWALGRRGIDDGLLVLVAKNDRKVRIHTGAGLESTISDEIAKRLIQEYLAPKFRRDDFAGGLDDATQVLSSLMNGEPLPVPMAAHAVTEKKRPMPVVVALLLAGLVALLLRLVLDRFSVTTRLVTAALATGACGALFSGVAVLAFPTLILGALIAALTPPKSLSAATGRGVLRSARWNPDELIHDFDSPEALRRRQERERENLFEGRGRGSGGRSSKGWSGGGGSSRGSGASGSW